MANEEKSVREAAKALHEAITQAEKKGYRVDVPTSKDGLLSIGVSESGKRFVEEITVRPATDKEIEENQSSGPIVKRVEAKPLVTRAPNETKSADIGTMSNK